MKRFFLKTTIISAILAVLSLSALTSCSTKEKNERPKYIFLFIGDGMGASHVSLAESYLSYKQGKMGGERLSFSEFPIFGMVSTYSANRSITCSAAAGTAIACGEKTNNTFIGVDPDLNKLESISTVLKKDGYKVGIISNVPINHATPGAFYANVPNRFQNYEIMKSIPGSGFEFFAGSGFNDYYGKDGKEVGTEEYLESMGYQVFFGKDEYEAKGEADKVVLCQKHNKGKEAENYSISENTGLELYTLDEMLKEGLEFLGDEEPFFIMCEEGMIDWAAHTNATMYTINHILELDEAVQRAYEFYLKHPDETLIIVTADHDTGGPSLGQGRKWMDDRLNWEVLDSAWNAPDGRKLIATDKNKELNDAAFIGWTTMQHTGNDVPVYAIGKWAEKFSGKMDNTHFKMKILSE